MKIQKIKNAAPYVLFALFCAVILVKPLGNGDELWNYSFAKNLVSGMIPYRDFSIVQTPLSAYIPALFMSIFGDGLFVHRVVGYLLLFVLASLGYHLCKREAGSTFIGLISALFMVCVILPFYVYNYNYLSAAVILVILELEGIESSKRKMTRNIAVGLLVGLLLLIKQNTGAMALVANFVVCVLNVIKFKMSIRTQVARVIASAVPMVIFVLYMLSVGALGDFLDYAVMGISTFVHRTTPLEMLCEAPFFGIYIVLGVLAFVKMMNHMRKKGMRPKKVSGFFFALAWVMIVYPLFDAFHLTCVFLVLIPAYWMFAEQKEYRRWEMAVCLSVVGFVSVLSAMVFLKDAEGNVPSSLNNYECVLVDEEAEQHIRVVCEYVEAMEEQGYRVRIADDSASIYKIPMDAYEKNWDMLLVGNIGSNSVQDLLKSPEKCLYLVYKHTESLSKQNHFELIEYIKCNYEKVGEVTVFDVYEAGSNET